MAQYYSVLTNYGVTAFAKAISSKQPLNIVKMAAGDGNGKAVTPNAAQTALAKEVYRAAISSVKLDIRNNKQVIFELIIPENIGGFYIREIGIFDNNDKLVAVANTPESYKPKLTDGSGKVQILRMILTVSSSEAVTLTVDNSLIWAKRSELTPKDLTANSQSIIEENGHSHKLPIASTTVKGIIQLNSATNSTSEAEAATPKAVKIVKDLIDSLIRNLTNYIPNSKKSNAVNSNSADTVATSSAVKTAYDLAQKANNDKVNRTGDTIKGDLILDKTAKNEWSALRLKSKGGDYRFEANPEDSDNRLNIVHQVGNTQKYLRMRKFNDGECFAYESWVRNGFAPLNNPNFSGTVKTDYRLVIERNEADYSPYVWLHDTSVDLSQTQRKNKVIAQVMGVIKNGTTHSVRSEIRTVHKSDKNAEVHIGAVGADNAHRWGVSVFGKTGNVGINKTTDDGINSLQVNGTVQVTAPAATANNNQVPTTAWVRNGFLPLTGGSLSGELNLNFNNYGSINQHNQSGYHARIETLPHSQNNFYKLSYRKTAENTEEHTVFFPKSGTGKTVAYQDWVNSRLTWANIANKPAIVVKSDFTQSLAQTGWTKLPNGLILQWGEGNGGSNNATITFPVKFPNACFNVQATDRSYGDYAIALLMVRNITPTNFDIQALVGNARYYAAAEIGAFQWIAIGY